MKLLSLVLLACSLTILLAQVGSPQSPAPSPLYLPTTGAAATDVSLAADSILREDPPNPARSPYASVIHLNGHVEIRTCCVQRPPTPDNPNRPTAYMVLRADEADYNAGTGEIQARGVVRVNFQDRK